MALSWTAFLVAAVCLRAAAALEHIEAVEVPAEAPEVSVAPASIPAVSITRETARTEARHIREIVECAHWAVAVTQYEIDANFTSAGAAGWSFPFFFEAEDYIQSWCDNVTSWGSSGGYEARSLVSDGENLCAIYFWKVKDEPFVNANRTSLGEEVVAAAKQAITDDSVNPEDPHSLSSTIFDIAGAPNGGSLAAVLAANSAGTKSLAVANPEHLPLAFRHVDIDRKERIALLALPH